eukprot:406538-Alexandrium_andersonii.AAC.1
MALVAGMATAAEAGSCLQGLQAVVALSVALLSESGTGTPDSPTRLVCQGRAPRQLRSPPAQRQHWGQHRHRRQRGPVSLRPRLRPLACLPCPEAKMAALGQ